MRSQSSEAEHSHGLLGKMDMKHTQSGFLLIEGLIAVLIFSLGILALVALQAVIVKETGEAKYRMEAIQYTNQLIGEMWGDNKLTLSTNFASPSGARYVVWKNQVAASAGLPGAASVPPSVVFGLNNQVTISIFWKKPGESAAHQHVTITQLQ